MRLLPLSLVAALAAAPALTPAPAFAQSGPPVPLPETTRPPGATPVVPPPGAPPAVPPGTPGDPAGLQSALRNFPPPLIVNNVHALTAPGVPLPPPCPASGARVEQQGGPTLEFLGAAPDDPTRCRMRVGGQDFEAWHGIWGTAWAGGDFARRALDRILHSKTGDVVGFDTVAVPGTAEWHDLIRQDGLEDIVLLDKTYSAIKLTHYREGFAGNTYRSISSLWIDVATGMPIYGTYQHISGRPSLDGTLIPTAIIPPPEPAAAPAPPPAPAPALAPAPAPASDAAAADTTTTPPPAPH